METSSTRLSSLKIIDIVQIGLMAALTFAATYSFHIPIGSKAVLHLADSMVFLGALLLGKRKGFLSAAIGMGLFDLLSPYAVWAPYTFIIKGVMAYIAATIIYSKNFNGKNIFINVLGYTVAGIWMIFGYFIAGRFVYGNFGTAYADIPGNIFQVVAGIVLALAVGDVIRTSLKKARISVK